MQVLTNQPLVIDNGSGLIKAGFAGGELPRVVFPTYVGTTKHVRMMPGGALEHGGTAGTSMRSLSSRNLATRQTATQGNLHSPLNNHLDAQDVYVGKSLQEHRGLFKIHHAMEHGIVTNWSDMQKIWNHIYSKDMLNVNSEDHPILLTEAPLNPKQNRQKAAEVFFESFNAPALFISPQAVLSLYASGRTTGVVLDCGDGVTHVVPVYESFTLPHAITRMDIAGRDVTRHLHYLLRRAGYNFDTSAEQEVVREIKEKLCYVAYHPDKEEQIEDQRMNSGSIGGDYNYTLPDGNQIKIGPERFRAPEILFQPGLIGSEYDGIHDCLINSILQSDMDLRKTLFSQIVLSGGSTMFSGFGDRLLNEVRKKAPKDMKIRISAPPSRKFSTWTGGSILASLATFKTMWISKQEYEEHGTFIVHRKTL